MVLSKQSLINLLARVFPETKPKKVSPASYDLTIGNHFKIYTPSDEMGVDNPDEIFSDEIVVPAMTFVLAHTQEYIHVPPDKAGLMLLRSSMGRSGWLHAFAGWVDPGFEGQLVFELFTPMRNRLVAGTRVAQLILFETDGVAQYDGKYQGQRGAVGAYQGAVHG